MAVRGCSHILTPLCNILLALAQVTPHPTLPDACPGSPDPALPSACNLDRECRLDSRMNILLSSPCLTPRCLCCWQTWSQVVSASMAPLLAASCRARSTASDTQRVWVQTCMQALSSLSCPSSGGKHGADVRAHAGAAVVHSAGGSHAGSVLGACGAPAPGAHWVRLG